MQVTIDFETRSAAPLKKTGAFRYASDPSTQVMMLAYKIDDGPTQLWYSPDIDAPAELGRVLKSGPNKGQQKVLCEPIALYQGDDILQPLFHAIHQGAIVEAHNAMFERAIWRRICIEKFGWPDIPNPQWRCSAAKAASYALPRSLEEAGTHMGLAVQKDMEGSKLLHKLMKRRKPTGDNPRVWPGDQEEFVRLGEYCVRDVDTEHELSSKLPDWPAIEWDYWHVDQRMNEDGIALDTDLARHCNFLSERVKDLLNLSIFELTGIEKGSNRKKIQEWLEFRGYELPNMQAGTLDEMLERDDLPWDVKEVVRLTRSVNKTTTSKFAAMLLRADEDGRARDNLMFHAASTGRWGGRGIQMQNLKRGAVKDMDAACERIAAISAEDLIEEEDDPIDHLGDIIRGLIIPGSGKEFMVADYSAIEARGTMWLAGQEDALDVFRSGADIYCETASDIYGVPIDKKLAKAGDQFHFIARMLGKQSVLGLGYQMGPGKFLITCRGYGIHFDRKLIDSIISREEQDEIAIELLSKWHMYGRSSEITKEDVISGELILAKYIVDRYRTKYFRVKELWDDLNRSAIAAVKDHQNGIKRWTPAAGGRVNYKVVGPFLACRLPSGRFLWYMHPELRMKKAPWAEDNDPNPPKVETLTYMGVDSRTKQFVRQATYGGHLTENVVQALSRDIMANALLLTERHPLYTPCLTVHDEIIAEVPKGQGDIRDFERLICQLPSWADGFPIEAEGERLLRYKK